jgi:long-chain acyl-CoA synthetase
MNPLTEVLIFNLRLLVRFFWKIDIRGREKFDGASNVIIAANHCSNIDIPWLFPQIPFALRRKTYLVGKNELWFLKYLFMFSQLILVKRGGDVIPSLKASADVLRLGKSIIIFPEGTRGDGSRLLPFKTGAAYLSKNLNIRIIPVGIKGSGHVLPRGRFIPKFFGCKALIIAGNSIDPAEFSTVDELNAELRMRIQALLD